MRKGRKQKTTKKNKTQTTLVEIATIVTQITGEPKFVYG